MTSIPPSQPLTPNSHQRPLPAPCYLFKFPNELVAETISWLPHPVDILWLSFTCKRFHNLLVDPTASYIWKHARERFVTIRSIAHYESPRDDFPSEHREIIKISGQKSELHLMVARTPIPSPFEGQAEYDFARMLFGWKRCQKCEKGYIGKLFSVLMRVALCPECAEKHGKKFMDAQFITYSEAYKDWHDLPLDKTGGERDYLESIWNASLREEPPLNTYWQPPALLNFNLAYNQPFGRAMRSDWDSLLAEFLAIRETKQSSKLRHFLGVTLKAHTERVVQRQGNSNLVVEWYKRYNQHLEVIDSGVLKISQLFATSHGLIIEDLQKAPAYRHAVAVAGRHQTVDISPFLISATPELMSQTLKIHANRIKDSTSRIHKTRRNEIEAFYKQHGFSNDIKPTLDTFRAIPILQALQRGISTAGEKLNDGYGASMAYYSHTRTTLGERPSIRSDLKEDTVRDLVNVSVMQWRERASQGARKLLGFEGYRRKGKKRVNKRKSKSNGGEITMEIGNVEPSTEEHQVAHPHTEPDADQPMDTETGDRAADDNSLPKWHSVPGKLDPEMRATSWFVCNGCINMEPGYKRMRVLDFRGVCAHDCWQKDWSKAQRKDWNIDRFALAPKAIETAERMLEILGLNAEDAKTTTRSFKGWWSCNNCPPWMSGMVWEDLLRHCQRHETQDIAQLSDEDAEKRRNDLGYKPKRLTFADLLSSEHEAEALTKQLACVHCRPTEASDGKRGRKVVFNAASSKAEKVMDIHGIRQHMKSKHHVSDCRNEDYYYVAYDRVTLPAVSKEGAPTNEEQKKKRSIKTTRRQTTKKLEGLEIIDIRF